MRTFIPTEQRCPCAGSLSLSRSWTIVGAALAAILAGSPLFAAPTPPTSAPVHKPIRAQKRSRAGHLKTPPQQTVQAPPAPVIPPQPALPKWPVNDQPAPAAVTWDGHGLRIAAANSSLEKILKDVASATGAKLEGFSSDQRVFGEYGPGPAREVLSRLLDGSGYNILLAGDLGQGAPREIVLTARTSGGPQPSGNASPSNNNDDDSEVDAQPPTGVPPMQPHGAARGPQQMIEAQRRRDMMERLNSQNPQANLGADPATTNPAPN